MPLKSIFSKTCGGNQFFEWFRLQDDIRNEKSTSYSKWIVNNKNGFIVNDFEELSSKVNSLINNRNLLSSNSEGAILLAKKFDWKIVINEWEEVLCNLR